MGSLVATPSLLSKVIESQGQDTEVVSIRDRVRSGLCAPCAPNPVLDSVLFLSHCLDTVHEHRSQIF